MLPLFMWAIVSSWFTLPPSIVSSLSRVRISTTFGKLVRVTSLSLSIVAAIIGSAAFLAPDILTDPFNFFPPFISK